MKKYLVTGLLVWVPLAITIWVLSSIVGGMDGLLNVLPEAWRPDTLIGVHIPGFGVLFAFLIVLFTGFLTANFLGKKVLEWWNVLLNRIPVVRSIYSSVKQVSDTLLSDKGNAFKTAVLVQFPREGVWTVAFQTGEPAAEILANLSEPHVSVFVPTTPNPTGGYFLIVPVSQCKPLNMSVDEALKYIVSMGVVSPNEAKTEVIPEAK